MMMTETEMAIATLHRLSVCDDYGEILWEKAEKEALRHLISAARKVEKVREWKDGPVPDHLDWPQTSAYELAQSDVDDILSAPDTEEVTR